MNIGIFTETFKPQINGVVTSISILENELTKMGHKVYIFTAADPKNTEKSPRIFRLPSFPFYFLPSMRIAFFYPPKLLLKLGKLKLDVIHTQTEFPVGIFGMLVSEFYKIPLVHTYHTMYVDYVHYLGNGHLFTPNFAKRYSRIFCNAAGFVIAPAQKAADSLISYGVKRPIKVIPTGFDFSHFSGACGDADEINRIREKYGIEKDAKVLVTVCRVAKEKSIDFLIRQMPKLLEMIPALKYVIVGDGPYKGDLIELCNNLGILGSVIFTGAVPWSDIVKYYKLGNLFVTASTSETQGLTYIEAMASKVAVAVRYDKSVDEIVIEGQTGYFFNDESDCGYVLYKALTSDNSEIIENAWQNIQKFSSESFAREIEAVYNEAIESKPKRTFKIKPPKIIAKMSRFVLDLRKNQFKGSK
ncbi:MAG: glycosyltransferase [Clostridiales bacterium]|jgi:1,2-diacylglycerol 3-alpha-glucosyltransferase|nr:glycosyltransferase [Clostridiales bacterium]